MSTSKTFAHLAACTPPRLSWPPALAAGVLDYAGSVRLAGSARGAVTGAWVPRGSHPDSACAFAAVMIGAGPVAYR